MNIFCNTPSDWLDLQNKVAYVFCSCGYVVETPKKVRTVRGEVEIDVYAKSSDMLICCECKNWNCNISQNTVFAFRTVLEDIGANKGIIIAKKGFQIGAYKTSRNTIIELKKWDVFLEDYKEKFLKNQVKNLLKIKSKLFRVATFKSEYTKFYNALNKYQRKKVDELCEQLLTIVLLHTQMCVMLQYEDDEEIGWENDMIDKSILDAEKALHQKFSCYYDYFTYINDQISIIVSSIENIYGTKIL